MTALDQLACISSLEKELVVAVEKLKVKRHVRETGLCRIAQLREEQVRLRHQISRMKARQELAKRLDNLTQQIEAKERQKTLQLSRTQGFQHCSQSNKEEQDKQVDHEAFAEGSLGGFESDRVLDQSLGSETEENVAEGEEQVFNDSGSFFSIPETPSVYEGFEFRDRGRRSGDSANQSQFSAESSTSGVTLSYYLPCSYSPALRSVMGRNQKRRHVSSVAPPSITSNCSPLLLGAPTGPSLLHTKSVSRTKHRPQQVEAMEAAVPIYSLNTMSPSPTLMTQTNLKSSMIRNTSTAASTNSSIAASTTTLSSISSTLSPPLIWEHSTTPAPTSPDIVLLVGQIKERIPSLLDATLEKSLLEKRDHCDKLKAHFT